MWNRTTQYSRSAGSHPSIPAGSAGTSPSITDQLARTPVSRQDQLARAPVSQISWLAPQYPGSISWHEPQYHRSAGSHHIILRSIIIVRSTRIRAYANARARKLATSRVVTVINAWCFQQGLAASFWARLNVVDNRWASWVFPCGSASRTLNTNTHAHHFCYEEKWPPKCMEHYGDPARSQQRSIFRENPTNFFTFVAR